MVGLFVIASMVWTGLLAVTVVIGAVFWMVRWLASGKPSIRTPADWGIILLLLMAGLSWLISALPGTTIPQVLRLLTGVLLFYAVVNWSRTIRRSHLLLLILALTGVSLSLFALVSVEWSANKLPFIPIQVYNWFSILVSDTIHANVMAGTLLLFAPVFLAVVLFNGWSHLVGFEKRLSFILCSLALILSTLIILFSASRGAWVAFIAVIALLIAMRWKWGFLFIVAISVGVVLLLLLFEPFELLGIALQNQTLGSMSARAEVLTRAIFMIEVFPFTGVGLGLFGNVAALIYPLLIASPVDTPHAHNLFMQVGVDLGIPGLIAWLAVLLVVFAASWRLYHSGRLMNDPWAAGLGAGFFCSSAALVLHGLLDSVVWGMVRQAPLVWLLWGTTIACSLVYLPTKLLRTDSVKITPAVDNGGIFDITAV